MRTNLGKSIMEKNDVVMMVNSRSKKGKDGSTDAGKSGYSSLSEFPANMNESDRIIYRPSAF